MATHTAGFKLDGKESQVLALSYQFSRFTEENGRPASRVRRGTLNLTLASEDQHKESVVQWLGDPDTSKDGEIIIYEGEYEKRKPFKTIKFEKGFVIDYRETFTDQSGSKTTESFTISAEKITVGSAKFDFKWPKA